tara:strand:- start:244 stop:555 length:312 start_codon:yes stop_codon:yes gene_type:complete
MRNFSNLLSGFFLLSVFIAAITFTYFNTESVSITFGTLAFSPLPVSAWIIGAFVFGGALGLLLGLNFLYRLKSRAELKRLTKELENARREVTKLRKLTLRDID